MNRTVKAAIGLVLAIAATFLLPIEVPWNLHRRARTSAIRTAVEAAVQSPQDWERLLSVELWKNGPESLPTLYAELRRRPEARIVGMKSLVAQGMAIEKAHQAPPPDLLLGWLDDPDPEVARLAAATLKGFTALPREPRKKPERGLSKEEKEAAAAEKEQQLATKLRAFYAAGDQEWNASARRWVSPRATGPESGE